MDKIWAVIPEIYFDILARIVPGSFLIATAFISLEECPVNMLGELLNKYSDGIGWTTPFGIVISYYTAILFQHGYLFLNSGANNKMAQVSGAWQYLNYKNYKFKSTLSPQQDSNGDLESLKRVIAEMAGTEALLGGLYGIAALTVLLFPNKLRFVMVLCVLVPTFIIFYLWHNKLYRILVFRMKILNSEGLDIHSIGLEGIETNCHMWEIYHSETPWKLLDRENCRPFIFTILLVLFTLIRAWVAWPLVLDLLV